MLLGGALILFLIYQVYILVVSPSFGMAFLSVLDVIIIGLVYREWQHQLQLRDAAASSNN